MAFKSYFKWFQIIGIILLIYILTRLDLNTIIVNVKNFDLNWLFVYGLLTISMLILKSLRWETALKKQGVNYSLKKILTIFTITSFWGIITPGRIGEFGKILYLQNDNLPFSRSIVTIIIDRIYDIALLFIMGIISFLFFINILVPDLSLIVLILSVLITLIIIIYFIRGGLWVLLKRTLRTILPKDKYERLNSDWSLFKADFSFIFISTIPKMFFYSIIASLCYYLQIYAVALGFGVNVSFIYLALCSSVGAIISWIPISIGGLGTREAVFIFLLSKVSISTESAVLISFFDSSVFAIIVLSILATLSYIYLKNYK